MADPKIALATVLREVRNAIRQAHEDAMAEAEAAEAEAAKDPTKKPKKPVMKFKECELEFAVDIEIEASGGIKFWVLKLGGGVKRTNSNTIKITYEAHGDVYVGQGLTDDPNVHSAKRQAQPKKESK